MPFATVLMSLSRALPTVDAEPATGVVAMPLIRKCEKCGSLDNRSTWSSADDAAKDDAFDNWTCPTCAWTEFDLVEAQEEPATA
jgi:ssDNA-binding Zn-finger/Zn-ribbon topoisomerase 1